MRVVVIGATGHIGGYLVPRLMVKVTKWSLLSRHCRRYYSEGPAWPNVVEVTADRDAEDAEGVFGERIAELEADAVIDLICFETDAARQLVEALRPRGTYLLHPAPSGCTDRAPSCRRPRTLRDTHSGTTGLPRPRSRRSSCTNHEAGACPDRPASRPHRGTWMVTGEPSCEP